MLRNVFRGAAGLFSVMVTLPAMAAEPQPAPKPVGFEPITLAEANAFGSLAQQGQPLPAGPQQELPADSQPAATPEPVASPWAGTLEIYGFTPLRATTSISRGATERELSGRVRDEIRERIRDPAQDRLADRDGERIRDRDREEIREGIRDRILDRLAERDTAQIRSRIRDRIQDRDRERIRERIRQRIGDRSQDRLADRDGERLRDRDREEFREGIRRRIRERIRAGIRDRVQDRLADRDGDRAGVAADRDLLRLLGDRIANRGPGEIRSRLENLGGKLADRSFPDQIEIPGFTARTDVGLGSILEHLTDIFYLRGSVEYKRIGFQTDLSYIGLGGQTTKSFRRDVPSFPDLPQPGRTVKAQVAATQGIYDFALRYRFGERERVIGTPGAVTVIPYAGLRVVDLGLETDTTFEGPLLVKSRSFSFGDPIAQPLIGLQGQVFLTPRLRLFARGDLGGFGANDQVDMSGNAQVGVGYAIGNSTHLNLSWRYLYLARDNGGTPNAAYTIDQNGIEMGVKFFL